MTDGNELNGIRFNLVTDSTYMNAIRQNIQKYLAVYSLKELSELSDVPYETLKSLLYSNTSDCKLGMIIKLAKALHISIDELVGAETIDRDVKESMCMLDEMPPQFLNYIRWAVRYNYENVKKKPTEKLMNVMIPKWENNLVATHIMFPQKFTASDDVMAKSFIGFEIPCDEFMPHFFKGDMVLLANDRKPRNNEYIVVHTDTSFWILLNSNGNHITLNDGRVNNNGEYLGYICHIERQ